MFNSHCRVEHARPCSRRGPCSVLTVELNTQDFVQDAVHVQLSLSSWTPRTLFKTRFTFRSLCRVEHPGPCSKHGPCSILSSWTPRTLLKTWSTLSSHCWVEHPGPCSRSGPRSALIAELNTQDLAQDVVHVQLSLLSWTPRTLLKTWSTFSSHCWVEHPGPCSRRGPRSILIVEVNTQDLAQDVVHVQLSLLSWTPRTPLKTWSTFNSHCWVEHPGPCSRRGARWRWAGWPGGAPWCRGSWQFLSEPTISGSGARAPSRPPGSWTGNPWRACERCGCPSSPRWQASPASWSEIQAPTLSSPATCSAGRAVCRRRRCQAGLGRYPYLSVKAMLHAVHSTCPPSHHFSRRLQPRANVSQVCVQSYYRGRLFRRLSLNPQLRLSRFYFGTHQKTHWDSGLRTCRLVRPRLRAGW